MERGNSAAMGGADIRSIVPPGLATDQTSVKATPGATPLVLEGYPAERVDSIRPGWFWHAAEDTQLKPLSQLLGLYYDSVGRNSVLRLNVPPNEQGLLATPDVAALDLSCPAIPAIYQTPPLPSPPPPPSSASP